LGNGDEREEGREGKRERGRQKIVDKEMSLVSGGGTTGPY